MTRILVAASEAGVRLNLRQMYMQQGYEVVEALDAQQCLQLAAQAAPDLIVLDWTISGQDALSTCSELRSASSVPILMLTPPSYSDASIQAGADETVSHPIRPLALQQRSQLLLVARDIDNLREREEWYRSIIENAAEGIFRLTADGVFSFANAALTRMLGYDHLDAVLSLDLATQVYRTPDEYHRILSLFDDHVSFESETQWQRRDGSLIDIILNQRCIRNTQGGVVFYEATVLDITRRRQAEAAEREQRLLAEALRDTAMLVSSALDLDEVLDRILRCVRQVMPGATANLKLIDEHGNAVVVRSNGYEAFGITRLPGNSLAVAQTDNLRRMMISGQPDIISDVRRAPGWLFLPGLEWIRSSMGVPMRVNGETIGFLLLDAQELDAFTTSHAQMLLAFANQAAIAIRNARLYQQSLLYGEAMEQRVAERAKELEREQGVLFAEDGRTATYAFINPALRELLGYQVEEIQSLADLKPDDMPAAEFNELLIRLRHALETQGIWRGDTYLKGKHRVVPVSLTATRLARPDGKLLGVVTLFHDRTEQMRLEDQKKRFIATAAHEIRTPLTSLKARLYMAQRDRQRLDDHLAILDRSVEHLSNLVESLLDMGRFETGLITLNKEPTDIVYLLRETFQLLEGEADERDIWLIDRLPFTQLIVDIDPERIREAFTNVVNNAIHHTPPDGAVYGEVKTDTVGYMVIQIRDTGQGIDAEHLPHIFEPFYRARKGGRGLGLGLSITKEIIDLHGGRIDVQSEPGKGTTFRIWLQVKHDLALA
jgi:PAS domain S-box-containing protein